MIERLRVRFAADVLVREDGHLLAGGNPFRLLRLTPAGARLAAGWAQGAQAGRSALARRLLDSDVLLPDPVPRAVLDDVAVVVPVRDAPAHLARCLEAIAATAPGAELIVVDDGSRTPVPGAIRHDRSQGPAAARNQGAVTTTRPLVAFVDADVVVQPGWLHRLAAHFDDPRVAAVAPRVLALDDRGWLGGYEARHSSLDMGDTPGTSGPGRTIPYVPSTTLVVRRDVLAAIPFAETLRVGEDVDLCWRLTSAGHRVVYDPAATVRHDHRLRPVAFARRRLEYAFSIGALARRHPGALPAFRCAPRALDVVGLYRVLSRHTEDPAALTRHVFARSVRGTVDGLAHAIRRTWSPLFVLFAFRDRRALGPLVAALAMSPRVRGRHALLAVADDLLAAAGTWAGCAWHGTAEPLLPATIDARATGS